MSLGSKITYPNHRQVSRRRYNEQKENDKNKLISLITTLKQRIDCRFCLLFSNRGEIIRMMTNGLYNKYTLKMDYYYKKDINAIINKRKKPSTIRFRDEQIFLHENEFLKRFYKKKEIKARIIDITNFCSNFKDYPKIFDQKYFKLMNERTQNKRKIEYYLAFKSKKSDELKKDGSNKKQISYSEILDESLKQGLQQPPEQQMKCIDKLSRSRSLDNKQKIMKQAEDRLKKFNIKITNKAAEKFALDIGRVQANAQNNHQLFSKSDSCSAIRELENIIQTITSTATKPKPMLKKDLSVKNADRKLNTSKISPKEQNSTLANSSFMKMKEKPRKNSSSTTEAKVRSSTPKARSIIASPKPLQDILNFQASSVRKKRVNNFVLPSRPRVNKSTENIKKDHPTRKWSLNEDALETAAIKPEHKRLNSAKSTSPYQSQLLTNSRSRPNSRTVKKSTSLSPAMRDIWNHFKIPKEKDNFQVYLNSILDTKQKPVKNSNKDNQKSKMIDVNAAITSEKTCIFEFNKLLNTVTQKDRSSSASRRISRHKPLEIKIPSGRQGSIVLTSPISMSSHFTPTKYFRNRSQGSVETHSMLMSPSSNFQQSTVHEVLAQESPKTNLGDYSSVSRASKAYKNSKRLIEKVFSKTNNYQPMSTAVLIKSSTRKPDQKSIMTTKNKKEWFGIASNETNDTNENNRSKMQSPQPPGKENALQKNESAVTSSSRKALLQAGGIKAFRSNLLSALDQHSSLESDFTSKIVLTSHHRKSQACSDFNTNLSKNRASSLETIAQKTMFPKTDEYIKDSKQQSRHDLRESRKQSEAQSSIRKIQRVIF